MFFEIFWGIGDLLKQIPVTEAVGILAGAGGMAVGIKKASTLKKLIAALFAIVRTYRSAKDPDGPGGGKITDHEMDQIVDQVEAAANAAVGFWKSKRE